MLTYALAQVEEQLTLVALLGLEDPVRKKLSCVTSTKVRILALLLGAARGARSCGHRSCFTSTKVQILAQKTLPGTAK